jgi:hypothetical protein
MGNIFVGRWKIIVWWRGAVYQDIEVAEPGPDWRLVPGVGSGVLICRLLSHTFEGVPDGIA